MPTTNAIHIKPTIPPKIHVRLLFFFLFSFFIETSLSSLLTSFISLTSSFTALVVSSNSGYLYFLNYIPKLALGDAHFYQLDLNSKTVAKIS